MNQEDIKTPLNSLSPEKKQGVWKNILTIILLFFFPIIGLILVWLLATWSKKEKIIVTVIGILYIILLLMVYVGMEEVAERKRDMERVEDVKDLALIIEIQREILGGLPLEGCTVADAKTTLCTGPGGIKKHFPNIKDPRADKNDGICGVPGVTGPCHYGISNEAGDGPPRTDDYQICFYLEAGVFDLNPGFNSVVTGVRMVTGCN